LKEYSFDLPNKTLNDGRNIQSSVWIAAISKHDRPCLRTYYAVGLAVEIVMEVGIIENYRNE
jgi:hypothetical protein